MTLDVSDLIIRINPNNPEATVTINKDGVTSQKTVSIDDLTASLGAKQVNTGILPKGTRYYAGGGSNFTICIETAPRVRNMLFDYYSKRTMALDNGKKYDPENKVIPFPTCLFKFNVKGGRIGQTKVATVKQTLNTENDIIYRFPFGNTFRDGRICWGNNTLPKISKPLDVVSVMALYFDAPFNGDLLDNTTIKEFKDDNGKIIYEVMALIKYLEKRERFPEEILFEMGNFTTFIGTKNE
jgi:hypothetical protein